MFSTNFAFFIRIAVSSLSLSSSRPRLTGVLLAFCGGDSFDRFDFGAAFDGVSGPFCLVTDDFDCVDVVVVVVVFVVVVFFDCPFNDDVNMYALINSLSDEACGDGINDFDTDTIE